jgi:hypothetical protein
MGRLLTIAAAVLSCLLIWKSGAINTVLSQQPTSARTLDAGTVINNSGDAMQTLKSVHLSLNGTLVLGGVAGVHITGSGDLVYPHQENLSLQLQVPTSDNQTAILAVNERIENGHEYQQIPMQSPAWTDVTGNTKGQIAPSMDPIANLEFAHAFRASRDLGDITMDHIDVHHFALAVDAADYIQQLKADSSSAVTPDDEALLGNARIEVEVWISASDSYIHQMKVDVNTTQATWSVTYHFSDFVEGGGPASA